MGRFKLPLQQKIIFGLFCLMVVTGAQAREIADVKIPASYECDGKVLPLQGAGLRTATWLNIKVYVLAYYANEKKATGLPACFNITYLRDFDNEDVDNAWAHQLKESSQFPYPKLGEHLMELKKFFGEIKDERTENFVLSTGSTKIYENGKLKGEIKGEEFQINFLSLWFGSNPPTKKLQEELLK